MSVLSKPPSLFTPVTIQIGGVRLAKAFGRGPQAAKFWLGKLFGDTFKAKVFKNYTPTEHDVFICTFSKSGTNWLLQMATQIAWKGAAEFEHIHDVAPWPEFPMPGLVALGDDTLWENAPGKRRAIKTSAPTRHVPLSDEATYLSVFRDPKEVLVSGYYFILGGFQLIDAVSFDYWRDQIFLNGPMGKAWADHTASWWAERHRANLGILNFREIKKDLGSHVDHVAGLMRVELNPQERDAVIERCGFDWMKANGSRFDPPPMPFLRKRPTMMRSGRTGNSGELLSEAQKAEIDAVCSARLEALGSDFPYDEWFAR